MFHLNEDMEKTKDQSEERQWQKTEFRAEGGTRFWFAFIEWKTNCHRFPSSQQLSEGVNMGVWQNTTRTDFHTGTH